MTLIHYSSEGDLPKMLNSPKQPDSFPLMKRPQLHYTLGYVRDPYTRYWLEDESVLI